MREAAQGQPDAEKSPDAVEAAPLVDEVVAENDQVRVPSATYQPGTVAPMHRHPGRVVIALDAGAPSFEIAGTHEVVLLELEP